MSLEAEDQDLFLSICPKMSWSIPLNSNIRKRSSSVDTSLPMKDIPARFRGPSSLILKSKKPVLYVGGGIISSNASKELTLFAERLGIPVTMTLMGLGGFPGNHPLSLGNVGNARNLSGQYGRDGIRSPHRHRSSF